MSYKKILYIGPHREYSGAGNSCRNYIKALHRAGHDVCVAPIFYTSDLFPEEEMDSEILPLETNYLRSYDFIIQHCHANDYVYDHRFEKNIGIFQFNSYPIDSVSTDSLKILDSIVVNSRFNLSKLTENISSDLSQKIKYVPELIDIDRIQNSKISKYQWINDNEFVFYTFGDLVDRKNFFKIVLAYIELFYDDPTTSLIIKTKPHFRNADDVMVKKEIDYMFSKAYSVLRTPTIEKRREPKIMVGKFDEEALISLHKNCNCYIDVSMGENFGYPVLEATAIGNTVITNRNSSSAEINPNAFMVNSYPIRVFDAYNENRIQNRTENYWYDVDYDSLKEQMIQARYGMVNTNVDISRYSYDNVEDILC